MALYEFNSDDAERFAHSVGIRTRRRGSQLEFFRCPYCSAADKWTFGISLRTGQFECKRASCGAKGNMITLTRDFSDRFELDNNVTRYFNLNDFNFGFKKFKEAHKQIESKDAAVVYLKSRGISEDTCRKYEITIKNNTDNVLVFPFKNEENELTFIKYRNIEYQKGAQGSKEWCEANCMPILFGMNHCEDKNILVITEGQMDSLSLAEAGIKNAVSVPTGANGFTWVPHCWDFVSEFNKLIVFGDCEHGEVTLAEELTKRFPHKTYVVRPESYLECKDANEMLLKHGKQALIDAIETAAPPQSKLLKRMNQIKSVDIEKTEAIETGYVDVDRMLSGGMHLGQLIILTGKQGDGKSTLMSNMIVNAISQGYGCMVYSGELVDFFFKNWLDRQLLGKETLRQSDIDMANKFYSDKLFLFDNNIHSDPAVEIVESEAILEAMSEAVLQNNVKLVCIDNLMTAIDLDPKSSLYELQSQFVGKLSAFAKLHNIVILLVAHPRKEGYGGDDNDNVSGSSEITKRADIVMKYQRPKPAKGVDPATLPPRELAITKNRLTGKITGLTPLPMFYDETSKRVADRRKIFNYNYIENKEEFYQVGIDEEVPF